MPFLCISFGGGCPWRTSQVISRVACVLCHKLNTKSTCGYVGARPGYLVPHGIRWLPRSEAHDFVFFREKDRGVPRPRFFPSVQVSASPFVFSFTSPWCVSKFYGMNLMIFAIIVVRISPQKNACLTRKWSIQQAIDFEKGRAANTHWEA